MLWNYNQKFSNEVGCTKTFSHTHVPRVSYPCIMTTKTDKLY